METLQTQTRPGLSGTALKLAACITMLIDHIGASCIEATYGVAYRTPPQILQLDRVLRLPSSASCSWKASSTPTM